MTKNHVIFLGLYLMAMCTFGQGAIETDKTRIERLIVESFDGIWSELNAENIAQYYTSDFLLLENSEVWNNDSIANYLNKAILNIPLPRRVNTIRIIEIKIRNEMAWVAYQNEAIFSVGDKIVREANWLESATAILTVDGWKLEMLHSTPMKKE